MSMYRGWEVNGKEYKLRLTTGESKELERKLGKNSPLNGLLGMESGRFMTLTDAHLILHASMKKFHHSITMRDLEEIYDDYVAEGGDLIQLTSLLAEVLKDAGFLPKDTEEEGEEVATESEETI